MKQVLIGILLLTSIIFKAQNTEWLVTSSTVTFKIKNAGFTVDGTFSGLKAKINFDAAKSYGNSIEATVDVKTINTGIDARNTHLKKEEYFNADRFPVITLKAALFTKQKDGSFTGFFKLTLKGVTKEVSIPFTFNEKDGNGILKGAFTIDRRDYGVGGSSMILSDNAAIAIEVKVTKK